MSNRLIALLASVTLLAACSDDTTTSSAGPACSYEFTDDVAYVKGLRLGSVADDGSDACCFDFDNDGEIDNKIGDFIKLASAFPQATADVNSVIRLDVLLYSF